MVFHYLCLLLCFVGVHSWNNTSRLQTLYNNTATLLIRRNRLVAALPQLGKEFIITFEMKADNSYYSTGNMFYMEAMHQRYLYIDKVRRYVLQLGGSANGHEDDYGGQIQYNYYSRFEISQLASGTNYTFAFKNNGRIMESFKISKPKVLTDVKIYFSHNTNTSANGYVRNILIRSAPEHNGLLARLIQKLYKEHATLETFQEKMKKEHQALMEKQKSLSQEKKLTHVELKHLQQTISDNTHRLEKIWQEFQSLYAANREHGWISN